MKNFFNSLLDFLHSYVDIFVMGGIIVVIVLTINWRLNILFTQNTGDVYANNSSSKEEIQEPIIPPADSSSDEKADDGSIDEEIDDPVEAENTPETSSETLLVEIPAGSASSKIGEILSNKGLVESANKFVTRAVEMSLDRKLQSGNFKIPKNSSLDNIIKIISKQI